MKVFGDWMREAASDEIFKGSGRRHAFEYGAIAELGGVDYGAIYHRGDCRRAEAEGRAKARTALANGEKILCNCCRQPFPRCA